MDSQGQFWWDEYGPMLNFSSDLSKRSNSVSGFSGTLAEEPSQAYLGEQEVPAELKLHSTSIDCTDPLLLNDHQNHHQTYICEPKLSYPHFCAQQYRAPPLEEPQKLSIGRQSSMVQLQDAIEHADSWSQVFYRESTIDQTAKDRGPAPQKVSTYPKNKIQHSGRAKPLTHKCPKSDCKSVFRRLDHLQRHIGTHTKKQPFRCWVPECCRSFSRSDNLNDHTKTHSRKGGRNRYVSTLDEKSSDYDPDFRGPLTAEGRPIRHLDVEASPGTEEFGFARHGGIWLFCSHSYFWYHYAIEKNPGLFVAAHPVARLA